MGFQKSPSGPVWSPYVRTIPDLLKGASKFAGSIDMSCSAKGAGNSQFNLCIPDFVSRPIRLDTLFLDDSKGICFKGPTLVGAEEYEFHLAS